MRLGKSRTRKEREKFRYPLLTSLGSREHSLKEKDE